MVVGSAVLYGSECWPIKNTHVQRLIVTEMRMIRWICGQTRIDRISNGVISDLVKVPLIKDKLKEIRLRQFGHVKRRSADAPVRGCERINIPGGKRGNGRSKKNLNEVIREDLKVVTLMEDMSHDRRLWQDIIRILDHRKLVT